MKSPDEYAEHGQSNHCQAERFTTSDGYRHFYRHWPAVGETRGLLLAIHGIQSHSGWYGYSSQRLAEAGYEVYFLDRRGSGCNFRSRGHAPHQDRLVFDVVQFTLEIQYRHPNLPLTLLGLSWGGKLAAVTASRYSHLFNRLILLYPGLRAHVRPSWFQLLQLKLAEWAEVEHKKVPVPLSDPCLFTDDPESRVFIRQDPLMLEEVTTSFLFANRPFDHESRQAALARQLTMPSLLMLAGKDRIIDNRETEMWFRTLPNPLNELRVYEDAAHTLEFEPNRETIFSDLIDWLSRTDSHL
ncbi:Alpha/beta hydrolase family protein [Polystyrenella longa]|uniref:Alpha/beta hydrolase family protein n=1 Tax=Polystyrenella longa TaxID=2528007 RepID=A0A518CMB8_9PLAN|nr:alpha/beta fold hydrolase [Polystyrenella longa]QDU80367.1 Alpha/beta hydrolase family protein [Polystyrenella longa]